MAGKTFIMPLCTYFESGSTWTGGIDGFGGTADGDTWAEWATSAGAQVEQKLLDDLTGKGEHFPERTLSHISSCIRL